MKTSRITGNGVLKVLRFVLFVFCNSLFSLDCFSSCDSFVPEESKTWEYLFGDKDLGIEIDIYKTCDPYIISNTCGCCAVPEFDGIPSSYSIDLIKANSSFSIDWGEQGPSVVVRNCGSIFPARGRIAVVGASKTEVRDTTFKCEYPSSCNVSGFYYVYGQVTVHASDTHYFAAYFDPNVFVVNGQRKSPCLVGGEITVTLVNGDCETLEKALHGNVWIFHQKVQHSYIECGDCSPDDDIFTLPAKQELSVVTTAASVGGKFDDSDAFNGKCSKLTAPSSSSLAGDAPSTNLHTAASSSSSCAKGTCGGGNGNNISLSIGNASVSVGPSLDKALSVYGSPDITTSYNGYGQIQYGSQSIYLRLRNGCEL